MVYFFVKIKVKYCLPYPLRPRSSSRIKQSLKTSFIQQKILSPTKLFPVSKDTQKCIAQGEQGERPLRPCLDCPPCWDLDNSIRGRKIHRQRMAIQKEEPVSFGKEERKGQCLYTVDTDCWEGSSERAELPQIPALESSSLLSAHSSRTDQERTLQLTAYLMLITYSMAAVYVSADFVTYLEHSNRLSYFLYACVYLCNIKCIMY